MNIFSPLFNEISCYVNYGQSSKDRLEEPYFDKIKEKWVQYVNTITKEKKNFIYEILRRTFINAENKKLTREQKLSIAYKLIPLIEIERVEGDEIVPTFVNRDAIYITALFWQILRTKSEDIQDVLIIANPLISKINENIRQYGELIDTETTKEELLANFQIKEQPISNRRTNILEVIRLTPSKNRATLLKYGLLFIENVNSGEDLILYAIQRVISEKKTVLLEKLLPFLSNIKKGWKRFIIIEVIHKIPFENWKAFICYFPYYKVFLYEPHYRDLFVEEMNKTPVQEWEWLEDEFSNSLELVKTQKQLFNHIRFSSIVPLRCRSWFYKVIDILYNQTQGRALKKIDKLLDNFHLHLSKNPSDFFEIYADFKKSLFEETALILYLFKIYILEQNLHISLSPIDLSN